MFEVRFTKIYDFHFIRIFCHVFAYVHLSAFKFVRFSYKMLSIKLRYTLSFVSTLFNTAFENHMSGLNDE